MNGYHVLMRNQRYVQDVKVHTGIRKGRERMKIISKAGVFDTDPTLHMTKLESGAVIIYAAEPDETMNSIWRRSVL